MKSYRLYRIDGAGRINTAEWLEAASDRSARKQAATLCVNGASVELWARDRLLARLGPPGTAETITAPQMHRSADSSQPSNQPGLPAFFSR